MKNNYSVYQHVTPDGMYYFGQTNNIKRRWEGNGRLYKRTALQPYIEKFGWENIQHIVLFENQSKENALWIEDFLITTAQEDGVCINKHRSGNISKEEGYQKQYYETNKEQKQQYYETNKEQIRKKQQQYREQNRDKIKQYYEQNKEHIREKQQQYYEQNKDKKREYYEQNKDKIREYRERNKDKFREYRREYYKRKKLEKQLKEAVETTLF